MKLKQSQQNDQTALITSARSDRDFKTPSLRWRVQLQVGPRVLSLPPQNERPLTNKTVSHFPSRSAPPGCLRKLLSTRPPCHCPPLGLASALNASATHLSSGLNEKAKHGQNESFVFIRAVTTSPEWFHYFLFRGQAWPDHLKGRSVNKVKPWSNISLWRPGVGLARRPALSRSPSSPECWTSTIEWEDYLFVEVTGFETD